MVDSGPVKALKVMLDKVKGGVFIDNRLILTGSMDSLCMCCRFGDP